MARLPRQLNGASTRSLGASTLQVANRGVPKADHYYLVQTISKQIENTLSRSILVYQLLAVILSRFKWFLSYLYLTHTTNFRCTFWLKTADGTLSPTPECECYYY